MDAEYLTIIKINLTKDVYQLDVGIAFHEKYRQYDFGPGHPFRGDRFDNALKFFEEQGLLKLPNVKVLKPEIAELKDLLRVHNKSYVDLIFDLQEEEELMILIHLFPPILLKQPCMLWVAH